jgi:putative endonuclease
MPGRATEIVIRSLDRIVSLFGVYTKSNRMPVHLQTGARGEEEAYFYLRRLGYVMVARNYRSPRRRGDIDLIGWDRNMLCFIEVKTRTTRDVKPAEAAVDTEKRQQLKGVAEEYLRGLPQVPQFRFDLVTVYLVGKHREITLFKDFMALP